MNTIHPGKMTPDERLKEIATILAIGILRHKNNSENKLNNPRFSSGLPDPEERP